MLHYWRCYSVIALLFGLSFTVVAQEVRVAVASNFYHTLAAIIQPFEQKTGIKVKLSAGSSGLLYAQIVRGAPFDLFFSADQQRPQLLEEQLLAISRKTYVYGRLALWTPQPKLASSSLSSDNLLAKERFLANTQQPLVMANPRLAPYGKAAEQTLASLAIPLNNQGKRILANNISQAYQFIDSGNANAGFVAYSLLIAQHNKTKQEQKKE